MGRQQTTQVSPPAAPPQKKDYSSIRVLKILQEKELISDSNQLGIQKQEEFQVKQNKPKEKQEMLER